MPFLCLYFFIIVLLCKKGVINVCIETTMFNWKSLEHLLTNQVFFHLLPLLSVDNYSEEEVKVRIITFR